MITDALIVGAGPAGLAASRELKRAGVDHVVLERGNQVGYTWANLYDSLVLHTASRLSTLPGLAFPPSTPKFPSRLDLVAYLQRYTQTFQLPVRVNADIVSLRRQSDEWIASTASGDEFRARAAVVATGIVANPFVPAIAGRDRFKGHVLHSSEYRRPDGFAGRRVLVVGAGNSAGEIATELANAGADVTLSIRSGAAVLPLEIAGVPVQYLGVAVGFLPKILQKGLTMTFAKISGLVGGRPVIPPPTPSACPKVPLIGSRLINAIRAGKVRVGGAIEEFTGTGARLTNDGILPFDTVILATGFQSAVGMLAAGGASIELDSCGFAKRRDGVISVDRPDLYFVGHTYDLRGTIFNIARDARRIAREIRARQV